MPKNVLNTSKVAESVKKLINRTEILESSNGPNGVQIDLYMLDISRITVKKAKINFYFL